MAWICPSCRVGGRDTFKSPPARCCPPPRAGIQGAQLHSRAHICPACPLQIMLSPEARNTAWVSFDGRKRQEIRHGDRCVSPGAGSRSRNEGRTQALPAAFIPLLRLACAGPKTEPWP